MNKLMNFLKTFAVSYIVEQLKNDIEKIKKWNAEIKSDLKVYIDLSMKGK